MNGAVAGESWSVKRPAKVGDETKDLAKPNLPQEHGSCIHTPVSWEAKAWDIICMHRGEASTQLVSQPVAIFFVAYNNYKKEIMPS